MADVERHEHTGTDSPKIDPRNLKGFPIFTSAPTHNAPDGTIILANISGTQYMYARIGGAWVRTTLS